MGLGCGMVWRCFREQYFATPALRALDSGHECPFGPVGVCVGVTIGVTVRREAYVVVVVHVVVGDLTLTRVMSSPWSQDRLQSLWSRTLSREKNQKNKVRLVYVLFTPLI